MSNYTPKSEETLAKEGLLPEGEYDFEVVETSDKASKKGNPMTTLKLHVFGEDGGANIIMDYIALGNHFGERKFRHAAFACGLGAIYETGNLVSTDFQGKCGKVKIKQQEGNVDYPLPKNAVADYIMLKDGEVAAVKPLPKDVIDDEVPF